MACFIVPATEAIVTTVATKIMEKKSKKNENTEVSNEDANHDLKVHFASHLKHLNGFLWGGSALLAFEHLWHGEIQPFFPFLTAASNPADTAEMLGEMSTVGVTMAALVTTVWGITTFIAYKIKNKSNDEVEKLES